MTDHLRIAVVSGSHRRGSQSLKVARYMARTWLAASAGRSAPLFDLAERVLPLWDEGVWDEEPRWRAAWGPIASELSTCDGLVLVTPEWGGMATPAMKNFLLLSTGGVVAHKPALLVAVSASLGGAYPIAELRMTSGKNSHLCFIPEHLIVRRVEEVLNGDRSEGDDDARLRDRIEHALALLAEYARALRGVRESAASADPRFRYGM